jgi:2-polyprenyl-3-methyl-5-hydroxy-6-metoxy-1,4-benzoquinol methylase
MGEVVGGNKGRIAGKGSAGKEDMIMKKFFVNFSNALSHFYGSISRKYYSEDFVRVYPNGESIDRHGRQEPVTPGSSNNFLNHRKVYLFAAQFAQGATAADIGCGSGYGSALLKKAGAIRVCGTDASKQAVRFAREHYGDAVEFSVQGITNMRLYSNHQFNLIVCSEVLEHIKEYGKENQALEEIKRIARPSGIIIIGTPNSELLGSHGFHFDEMDALMKKHFTQYCIFENALVPVESSRELWERRLAEGRTGVIVTEAINLDETVLTTGVNPQIKKGIPAVIYHLGNLEIDTTLLHNTHSWAIVALNDPV